jgi:VanZ family protein
MRRVTARRLGLGALLLALLAPLFLGIPPHLRYDPLIGTLGARYHIGLFLVLTLLLYRHGPTRGRLRLTVLVCLLLGAVTEIVQTRFGRSAAVFDWYLDALGVGLAVCWIWYRRGGRLGRPLAGALVLAALVLWPLRDLPATVQEARAMRERFPVLADFSRPGALVLWHRHQDSRHRLTADPERGPVLQVDHDGPERWPGASSRKLPWDWRGFAELRVDCRLVAPSPDSLRIVVYLEDRAGPKDIDHAWRTFSVGHGWQTLVVPLAELRTESAGRPLSRQEVPAVSIFAERTAAGPLSFRIDALRLVAGAAGDAPTGPDDGGPDDGG